MCPALVLAAAGANHVIGKRDPSGHKQPLRLADQALDIYGTIDIVVNNAVAPTVFLTVMGQKMLDEASKEEPVKARISARRFVEPCAVVDLVLWMPASRYVAVVRPCDHESRSACVDSLIYPSAETNDG
jgi:NAD(P)-dependent dehydrogenase (short-subunit alcohol dehydrogenase family)